VVGGNDITPQYEVEMRPAYFGPLWVIGVWLVETQTRWFRRCNWLGLFNVGDDGRLAIWLGKRCF
jgi:hypothetical protein